MTKIAEDKNTVTTKGIITKIFKAKSGKVAYVTIKTSSKSFPVFTDFKPLDDSIKVGAFAEITGTIQSSLDYGTGCKTLCLTSIKASDNEAFGNSIVISGTCVGHEMMNDEHGIVFVRTEINGHKSVFPLHIFEDDRDYMEIPDGARVTASGRVYTKGIKHESKTYYEQYYVAEKIGEVKAAQAA